MSVQLLADIGAGSTLHGPGVAPGWSADLGVVLFTAAVLLVANLAAYAAWRWFRRDGLERAFLVCAARSRLSRRARGAVRSAAGLVGAPPVALVLSEHAFTEAQRAAAAAGVPEGTIAALSQARGRLFA